MLNYNQQRIAALTVAAALSVVALIYGTNPAATVAGMIAIEKTSFELLFKYVFVHA